MEHLLQNETILRGYWLDLGSRLVPDATWEKITNLTATDLKLQATSADGLCQLYLDPRDHRFWELSPVSPNLPQGPPVLQVVAIEQIQGKYPGAFSA